MAQLYTVPIPVTGESAGWKAVGNPAATDSDRALSSPLCPSIPVRNETQTPPGTAVSQAPPADHFSVAPSDWATSPPVPAEYSSTTAPYGFGSRAAAAYRFSPPGPAARAVRSRPGGRTARASTAPVLADTRSRVRPAPAQTDPGGPAVTTQARVDGPGRGTERIVASAPGLASTSTGWPPGPDPGTHSTPDA